MWLTKSTVTWCTTGPLPSMAIALSPLFRAPLGCELQSPGSLKQMQMTLHCLHYMISLSVSAWFQRIYLVCLDETHWAVIKWSYLRNCLNLLIHTSIVMIDPFTPSNVFPPFHILKALTRCLYQKLISLSRAFSFFLFVSSSHIRGPDMFKSIKWIPQCTI